MCAPRDTHLTSKVRETRGESVGPTLVQKSQQRRTRVYFIITFFFWFNEMRMFVLTCRWGMGDVWWFILVVIILFNIVLLVIICFNFFANILGGHYDLLGEMSIPKVMSQFIRSMQLFCVVIHLSCMYIYVYVTKICD